MKIKQNRVVNQFSLGCGFLFNLWRCFFAEVKPTSLPSECFSCGMLESSSGWVAESSELGEWYQMDAGAPTHVSGIAIKKRADADEWISKFLVSYSVSSALLLPARFTNLFVTVVLCVLPALPSDASRILDSPSRFQCYSRPRFSRPPPTFIYTAHSARKNCPPDEGHQGLGRTLNLPNCW